MKKGSKSSCPKGQIMRKGYKKKTGSRVPSRCITATSQSGLKRSVMEKKQMSKMSREHKIARKKFGTPKCKSGEILKEGYHRRAYSRKSRKGSKKSSRITSTWIPPTCVASQTGRPHGKQLFTLEKGDLKPFGYHDVAKMTKSARQTALKKALAHIKPLPLYRKLNALYVVNENKNPSLARIFKDDSNWVKTTKEYMNRPTNKSKKGSKKGSKRSRN